MWDLNPAKRCKGCPEFRMRKDARRTERPYCHMTKKFLSVINEKVSPKCELKI